MTSSERKLLIDNMEMRTEDLPDWNMSLRKNKRLNLCDIKIDLHQKYLSL